jgi:hypothetical protein
MSARPELQVQRGQSDVCAVVVVAGLLLSPADIHVDTGFWSETHASRDGNRVENNMLSKHWIKQTKHSSIFPEPDKW